MLLAPFISRIRRKIWIWVLMIVGGVLGDLPDILGAYGIIALHDSYRLYLSAHYGAIKHVIRYIPMCWLHITVDPYMHDPDRLWHHIHLRIMLEVLLWILNIVVIAWFVRIWRHNRVASVPIPLRNEQFRG
jgi:hypothetical protein